MKRLRNQSGDTLVEVSIAIAIMSVMLVTAYNIGTMSFKSGMHARERTQAVYLAQDQAEKLRLYRDEFLASSPAVSFAAHMQSTCSNVCYMRPTPVSPGPPIVQAWRPHGCSSPVAGSIVDCLKVDPFYTIGIRNVTNDPTSGAHFRVSVEWASAVAQEQNHSDLEIVLVDNRITPRNCDLAGDPTCR